MEKLMPENIEISVIIPCYNEELVISESHKRLSNVMNSLGKTYELIFINDGSSDHTENILEGIAQADHSVKWLSFSRNFGHQNAVTAGLKYCSGNLAVIIDADLQDPPEVIPEMLHVLQDQKANVVYGVRKKRLGESRFKLLTAQLFYRLMNYLSEIPIPVDTGDFRLIDRCVIDAFNRLPEKNKYIRGLISWIGFKQTPFYYERDKRFAGETKYPFKKMLKFASTSLLYFSKKPLKIATTIGLISIGLGLFYVSLIMGLMLFGIKALVSGWASLIVTIIFFGGIQLLTIGVLGQYIGILFDETKGRPEYIIKKMVNFE